MDIKTDQFLRRCKVRISSPVSAKIPFCLSAPFNFVTLNEYTLSSVLSNIVEVTPETGDRGTISLGLSFLTLPPQKKRERIEGKGFFSD